MATESEYCQKFNKLSMKFNILLYSRNEKDQQYINSLLDDLNTLNYKLPIVSDNNKGQLLIHQICDIIPPTDIVLVLKCCKLITSLITQQRIVLEGRTLSFTIQWLIQVLKLSENITAAIFQCLESLIRDNIHQIQDLLPELIGNKGILLQYTKSFNINENKLWVLKCLEAIVYHNDELTSKIKFEVNPNYLETCTQIFLSFLTENKPINCDEIVYCKLIISCLRGLQNVLSKNNKFKNFDLGIFLGCAKTYMSYYLYESNWIKPQKIMPSNLSVADLKQNSREKKGGKITKQRKQRKSNFHWKDDCKRTESYLNSSDGGYTPAVFISDSAVIVISDSDFSDSDTGRSNKTEITQGRVRQAALNLLISIIKVIDKHVVFGYWCNFFSDGSPSNVHNLNQCLLEEPSIRGRIAILNVMSTILGGSKFYLSQAETSVKTFAFTPFSMVLGAMIEELHHCLCFAFKDTCIPVVTQTLKCLALLVQATPYHRLSTGLLNSVITQVKPFIRHKDTTVQVAALIVLGCVVASEPVIQETVDNLSKNTIKMPNVSTCTTKAHTSQEDIEFAEFSSDEEEVQIFETNCNMSWLLEKCLRNLGVIPTNNRQNNHAVPAPVKLESLQVISAMCRNHFHLLLAPHILQVAKAFEIALCDKYLDLRLHAGRAIDSVGHAIQQNASEDVSERIPMDYGLLFWQGLLNGPLINLLQNEQNAFLRSIGCDCLGSIGSEFFEHLPKDKQLLIITLLFSCSRDEENNVKGAAVRALAICVLYPSLREDLGFIMDTTEAIMRTLTDTNLTVRIKSSWSLGNLSDALVLYRNNPTNEDFPDDLLYKLLRSCIKVGEDNNKIKSNAVRALGNLLRLITQKLLEKDEFKEITEQSVNLLIKHSTSCSDMKVRWNSCYAIGNFMKNNDLFTYNAIWQENIYPVLMDLVVNVNNFKVRINSALALSVPEKRTYYNNFYFSIWKSLLKALDNSQNIEDFNEFKHRDNLVDQICLTLGHLSTFLNVDDLNNLNILLVHHVDTLKTHVHRVQERLVPEKAEIFLKASNNIVSLKTAHLSNEQSSVVLILENIFVRNDLQ